MGPRRVLANWFLPPEPTLRQLGIQVELDPCADWQVLKKYRFGELGWDYEEGLRFESTTHLLSDLVQFVREYHVQHNVPFVRYWSRGFLCCSMDTFEDDPAFSQTCQAAGLVRQRDSGGVWELREA